MKKGYIYLHIKKVCVQVQISNLEKIQKVRLWHDCSGDFPQWFVQSFSLKLLQGKSTGFDLGCEKEYEVEKWLSPISKAPYQTAVDICIDDKIKS